jgi:SAM-dependent methyltransferase
MEVGYGTIGWLGDLISGGVKESSIYGIELDRSRAQKAKSLLPIAELQIGDASSLPWDEDSFGLVIISTVLSSILSEKVRRLVAQEIARVTVPGGAVLCYDLAINNPNNSKVLKVTSAELYSLFPGFRIRSKAVTLAPPLARLFAPLSWSLATWLQSVPFLRTHLLSVLIKQ